MGSTEKKTCKDYCEEVLEKWPVEHFTHGDMYRRLRKEYNKEYSGSSIAKALRTLFLEKKCRGYASPLTYFKRRMTPEEESRIPDPFAAYYESIKKCT